MDRCSKCHEDHKTEDHHYYWITIEDYLMQKQNIRNRELNRTREKNGI